MIDEELFFPKKGVIPGFGVFLYENSLEQYFDVLETELAGDGDLGEKYDDLVPEVQRPHFPNNFIDGVQRNFMVYGNQDLFMARDDTHVYIVNRRASIVDGYQINTSDIFNKDLIVKVENTLRNNSSELELYLNTLLENAKLKANDDFDSLVYDPSDDEIPF